MTIDEQRDFLRCILANYGKGRTDAYLNEVLRLSEAFKIGVAKYLVESNFNTEINVKAIVDSFVDRMEEAC